MRRHQKVTTCDTNSVKIFICFSQLHLSFQYVMIDNDSQLDRISEDPGDQPLGRFVRKLLDWVREGGETSIIVNSTIPWAGVPCLNEKEKPS